jgi:murein DD-endopeptidase MepM/ murein hydrolase activator NlpD
VAAPLAAIPAAAEGTAAATGAAARAGAAVAKKGAEATAKAGAKAGQAGAKAGAKGASEGAKAAGHAGRTATNRAAAGGRRAVQGSGNAHQRAQQLRQGPGRQGRGRQGPGRQTDAKRLRDAAREAHDHRRDQAKKRRKALRNPKKHLKNQLKAQFRSQLGLPDRSEETAVKGARAVAEKSGRFAWRRIRRLAQLDRKQKIRKYTRWGLYLALTMVALIMYPLLTASSAPPPLDGTDTLDEPPPANPLGAGPIPEALMGTVAQRTGIPIEALRAYSAAAGGEWALDWKILAAVGRNECDHGRSKELYCTTPYNVWRTDRGGAGERGPMQHLGHLWRVGHDDPNEPDVKGPPTPHNDDSTHVATDGNGDGIADPWNWYDAVGGAARKMTLYRKELKALNPVYDTDDWMIAAYNAGVWGATHVNGQVTTDINHIVNKGYVDNAKTEFQRIQQATADLNLSPTGGFGLCPVGGKVNFSDTWGAPRSGGRSHMGVDMMAAMGTPVVAVENGTVTDRSNNLGGNAYGLVGVSGTYYYGAHLSAFGKLGQVKAGEVIGYVGDTGDAKGGPTHLHWEVHPGGLGSPAVNPTPTADRLCGKGGANTQHANTGVGAGPGGYTLPLPQKWFDSNRYWFTKPHHDYPAADIPVPAGTEVYAAASGTVAEAPAGGSCGLGVTITGSDGVRYIYCHGTDGGKVVRPGQHVNAGQLIMHVGSTGNSTGPHLHFGLRVNGVSRCPQNFLVAVGEGRAPNLQSLPTSGCSN